MSFEKRRVGASRSPAKKRSYQKKAYKKRNKILTPKSGKIKKIVAYILVGLLLFGVLVSYILYLKIIAPLPSVSELENLEIAEASVIYDREGNELYKIFKEKRTYVDYSNINKNMINALVAGEDKRFWDNPGVDFVGLIRAAIYGVIGKNEGF